MADGGIVGIVIVILQVLIGILLSVKAVYISIRIFSKLMFRRMDEWKELKNGNAAVAVLLAGFIFSIAIIIEGGVSTITRGAGSGVGVDLLLTSVAIEIIDLLISIIAAIITMTATLKILDRLTDGLNEMEEIRKGNVAVAVLVAAVLVAVSFVVRGAAANILKIINGVELLRLLGL